MQLMSDEAKVENKSCDQASVAFQWIVSSQGLLGKLPAPTQHESGGNEAGVI